MQLGNFKLLVFRREEQRHQAEAAARIPVKKRESFPMGELRKPSVACLGA
jgi:hypothetical protein